MNMLGEVQGRLGMLLDPPDGEACQAHHDHSPVFQILLQNVALTVPAAWHDPSRRSLLYHLVR